MSVIEKMMDVLRLNDEDEYYDEEYDELEEEEEEKKSIFFKKTGTDDYEEAVTVHEPSVKTFARGGSSSKITPMRSTKQASAMEVCIIKPQGFEDSKEISETLLANRTVILNMEGLDLALAQRIIDFISGSCYAINGNLQKISSYIFIVTPKSVDISGDLQDLVGAFDLAGLQTGF